MASNGWPLVPIGRVAIGIYDGPHATPTKTQEGPVFLGIESLSRGRLDLTRLEHLSEADFVRWTRRVTPQPEDLVFSYETRLGEAALVPKDLRCCLGRRMALVRPDTSKIDPRFLLYYFLGPEFQELIRSRTIHGSTVDRIPLREFPGFFIRAPPISEQIRIGNVLGVLDEKIDLNRRMNQTLEAMARAIFKSWFVDFDPVREGHPLFPPTLMSSRLGSIPTSWRIGSLLEQADLMSGGTPKTSVSQYWDGEIPWASAGDVSQCREVFLIRTQRSVTSRGIEESSTQIIPPWSTVVVARGATTGRHVMFGAPIAMNQTCYALQSKFGADVALYCQIGNAMNDLVHASHGSVFDTITTQTFKSHATILPDSDVLLAFGRKVRPLFELILCRQNESLTLTALRDALLPKLLSGEIRVKQAEKIVGEAT